jgi:hypothetical protein
MWASPLDSRGAHAGRSVVASAPALGAGDREFESPRPDHERHLGAVITDTGEVREDRRRVLESHPREVDRRDAFR